MPVESPRFDLGELSRSIRRERERRGVSMTALAAEVGVAASTIRRFETASDAEADGVLALLRWLGVAPEDFIAGSSVRSELLPDPGEGCIRVDMSLVAAAAGVRPRGRTSTRTTIQRLVLAAHHADQSVASLTRWSPV